MDRPIEDIKFLGIPFAYGQSNLGVKYAPDFLRNCNLIKNLSSIASVKDLGNLSFNLEPGINLPNTLIRNHQAVSWANQIIAQQIARTSLDNSFLLNLGGDHGMGLGTVHGLLNHYPDMILVWGDAHGDINPPEFSPSGNFHGMPLAFLLEGLENNDPAFAWIKHKIHPNKIILFGPRSLDAEELRIIKRFSIQYFSSEDINTFGATSLLTKAFQQIDPNGQYPIHLSLDIDLLDPSDAFSTGTKENHGPKLSQVFSMGEFLANTGRLRSMDLVELDPYQGNPEQIRKTFHLGMELVHSIIKSCFHSQPIVEEVTNNLI